MRDANAAFVYGGVCSTDKLDDPNVRIWMVGEVHPGRCGSTCKNVAGGINATQRDFLVSSCAG